MSQRRRGEFLAFGAFMAPGLVLFAVWIYWPILYSLYLSTTQWNFLAPAATPVGLDNYAQLARDPQFWQVFWNTLLYACVVVLVAQALGFCLALLLNRRLPGQAFFRLMAFTPHVTTTAAAALVFVLLLDPRLGPLSILYNWFGVTGPNWLNNASLALWAVALVGIWKEIGFSSVFFLAGLGGINRDYYEAALVDGASRWALLRHITLPLMTPTIFFLMVSGFIASVQRFDIVAIMTGGGPVYPASSTYVFHLYKLAFRDFRAGYASAFAMVFFVIIIAVTLIQNRLSRRWVHYSQ